MSESQVFVFRSPFWLPLFSSVILHLAVGGLLTMRHGAVRSIEVAANSPPVTLEDDPTRLDALGNAASGAMVALPVEIDRASETSSRDGLSNPAPVAADESPLATDHNESPPTEARAVALAPRESQLHRTTKHNRPSQPRESDFHAVAPRGSVERVLSTDSAPPVASAVDSDQLRQAMLAAAINSSAGTSRGAVPPGVQVDPREKNLDRAFSRAFAWAFAVDRSFFTAVPVGRARFVLELGEDGRITVTHWLEPRPSARMKELVSRMVKLLAANRFRLVESTDEMPRRAYEMRVTDRRLERALVPSAAQVQTGDLWMLGAGETPTPDRPSHPAVADATGHQIDCELRIVSPTPLVR